MASRPSQSLAVRALRCGLLLACVGLFFATALYFANPWMGGFPEWGIFLWPTAVMMMGLSGISERAAVNWTVAIIASNALWYFVIGVILTPPIILAWRGLVRRFR